jgi:hypothetical protein
MPTTTQVEIAAAQRAALAAYKAAKELSKLPIEGAGAGAGEIKIAQNMIIDLTTDTREALNELARALEPPNTYADLYTKYIFLLAYKTEEQTTHFEVLYDKSQTKFMFDFNNIPDELKFFIFKNVWLYNRFEFKVASWFNQNTQFSEYFRDKQIVFNALKRRKRIKNNATAKEADYTQTNPKPTAFIGPLSEAEQNRRSPAASASRARLKTGGGSVSNDDEYEYNKNNSDYDDDDDDDDGYPYNMSGGQGKIRADILNKSKYMNVNNPNNINKNDESRLSYYVHIDLELFPGDSISMRQRAVLGCQIRYEKIRQSFAELFNFEYRPLEFTTPGYIAPPLFKIENNPSNKGYEDNMRSRRRREDERRKHEGSRRNRDERRDERKHITQSKIKNK